MSPTVSPETFDEHVEDIVKDFLQTVVVVDDQAFEGRRPRVLAVDAERGSSPSGGRGRGVTADLQQPTQAAEHSLDPKAMTDAFAREGLVCSLLSPEEGETVDENFLHAARRADLVVLDWVLHRDEGKKTLDLVKKILDTDEQPTRRRLRTIAIYTGEKELRVVATRLRGIVDAAYDDCQLETQDDGLTMTKGPVRAAVFAKDTVVGLASDLETRKITFDELPARLRSEFASLTNGLVTGVALAALAALRDDTHRVLKTLNPDLDAAYLGHRSALPVPDDAREHAVALVAAEIRSVIDDNEVGRNVDLAVLKLWLADAKRKHLHFGELIDPNKRLSTPQVEAMLLYGLGTKQGMQSVAGTSHSEKYLKTKVKPQATKVFTATNEEAAESDADFAYRTMTRTRYSYPPRTLQLGTIVHSNDIYRLCLQPLCDSVRITKTKAFPFLPLEAVGPDDKPNFVVTNRDGPGWIHLRLGGNPSDLHMVSFEPTSGAAVTATVTEDIHSFIDIGGGVHRWVGELKPDFSQREAFNLAQQFARIAVDEAEIFRLSRE
jgi:hypothetical protein